MKTKYLSLQLKQFVLSSVFVAVAAVGLTVSNSFDQEYMAKVEQVEQQQMLQKYAATSEQEKDEKEEKTGVAMN